MRLHACAPAAAVPLPPSAAAAGASASTTALAALAGDFAGELAALAGEAVRLALWLPGAPAGGRLIGGSLLSGRCWLLLALPFPVPALPPGVMTFCFLGFTKPGGDVGGVGGRCKDAHTQGFFSTYFPKTPASGWLILLFSTADWGLHAPKKSCWKLLM